MTKQVTELTALWNEWLAASQKLMGSLHEQTAALTLRQVDRLDELQPRLDAMMTDMEAIDNKALALAKKLAEDLGAEPSLRSLVSVLDKTDAEAVQSTANKVIVAGRDVQKVMNKNKALIENELEYVNGTMSLVAQEATGGNSYSGRRSQANVLMNQSA